MRLPMRRAADKVRMLFPRSSSIQTELAELLAEHARKVERWICSRSSTTKFRKLNPKPGRNREAPPALDVLSHAGKLLKPHPRSPGPVRIRNIRPVGARPNPTILRDAAQHDPRLAADRRTDRSRSESQFRTLLTPSRLCGQVDADPRNSNDFRRACRTRTPAPKIRPGPARSTLKR